MNLPPIKYIQPGPMAPEASISAATAPARGMMEVGKALGETGDRLLRISAQMRRSEETKIRGDLFNQIEGEAGRFKDGLLSRSDYSAWGEEFDSKAAGWEALANDKGLSPEGRAIFDQQFNDWRSRTRIGIETNAAMKSVTDGRLAAANTLRRGIDTRDRDTVRMGVNEMRRNGASPAEIEKIEYDAEGAINAGLLEDMIDSDPSGWDERLANPDSLRADYPGISDDDVERLRRRAEGRTQELRSEVMDALDLKSMEGKLQQADIDAAPHLTDKDKAIYTQRLEDSTPPTPEDMTTAWQKTDMLRAARTDPGVSQEQYRSLYNETRAAVLGKIPLNYQGDLKKELGYLSPAGRDPSAPDMAGPITGEDVFAMGRDQITRALDADQFGKTGKEAPAAEREAAHRKAGHLRLGLKRYLSTLDVNDPETPAKVQAWIDGEVRGEKTDTSAKDFGTKVPGAGNRLRPVRRDPFEAEGVLPKLKPPGEDLEDVLKEGAAIPRPQPPDYINR